MPIPEDHALKKGVTVMQMLQYGGTTASLLGAAIIWVQANVVTATDLNEVKAELVNVEARTIARSSYSALNATIQKYEAELFTLQNLKAEDRGSTYNGRLGKVQRELRRAEIRLEMVKDERRALGIPAEDIDG